MLYQTMAEVAALLRRHQFPQSHLHLFRIFDAVHNTNPVDQTDTTLIDQQDHQMHIRMIGGNRLGYLF